MGNTEQHRMIELVQHTPMWHFQSTQKGCCLRASEVKPKLDRFLAEKEKKKYTPLDYKMYFIVNSDPVELVESFKNNKGKEVNKFTLFFGNMNNPTKKHLVYYDDSHPIEMHLFSLDTNLLDKIEKALPAFFACHSFGTRQDKGFGFFYPKDKKFDDSDASYLFTTTKGKDDNPTGDFQQLFKFIEMFHKMIRSGVNFPGKTYCKSFMYFYAQSQKGNKDEKVHWDKPVIRHHFSLTHPKYKRRCGQSVSDMERMPPVRSCMKKLYHTLEEMRKKEYENNRWLFRDALGLASSQDWRDYHDTLNIVGEAKDSACNKVSIKRFQSPVLYRPVPNGDGSYTVYIYLRPIPETYRNATFTITDKPDKDNPRKTPEKPLNRMGIHPEFHLDKYFDFIIQHCQTKGVVMEGKDYYIKELFIQKGSDGKLNFRKIIHK